MHHFHNEYIPFFRTMCLFGECVAIRWHRFWKVSGETFTQKWIKLVNFLECTMICLYTQCVLLVFVYLCEETPQMESVALEANNRYGK